MALFTCSVCGKTTRIDTTSSLVFTNCLLTPHCNGRLYRDVHKTNSLSVNVNNRYKLEVIRQTLLSTKWVGKYNINTLPYVIVYQLNSNNEYIQLKRGYTTYIDNNSDLVIEFDTATAGVAHIITNTSFRLPEIIQPAINYSPLTANGVLTVASLSAEDVIQRLITYSDPVLNETVTKPVTFIAHKSSSGVTLFNTPWKQVSTIMAESRPFRLFSCNISSFLPNISGIPWTINFSDDVPLLSLDPYLVEQDCNLNQTCLSVSNGIYNPPNLWVEDKNIYSYYPQMRIKSLTFDT